MLRVSSTQLLAPTIDGLGVVSDSQVKRATRHFVLLAAPGSGKGTFAQYAVEQFGYKHLCVGDLLRAEVAAQSELGKQVKPFMERGEYVDERITCALIAQHLLKIVAENGSFIIDGVPPSESSMRFLIDLFAKNNLTHQVSFVQFVLSDDASVQRIKGRVICQACAYVYNLHWVQPKINGVCDRCNSALTPRLADNEEITRKRLAFFHQHVEPLLAFAASSFKVKRFDTEKDLKELHAEYTEFLA